MSTNDDLQERVERIEKVMEAIADDPTVSDDLTEEIVEELSVEESRDGVYEHIISILPINTNRVEDEDIPIYRTGYRGNENVISDSEARDLRESGYRTFDERGEEVTRGNIPGNVAYIVPDGVDLVGVDHPVGEKEDDTKYVKVIDGGGGAVYFEANTLTIEDSGDRMMTAYADDYDSDNGTIPWNDELSEPGEYGWHFTTLEVVDE